MLRSGAPFLAALVVVGCASDPESGPVTVAPETAYVAIVQWELDQVEPVVDEAGDVVAPVIYLASASGETVDVRVQASVVSTVDEAAVIRFADQAADALDADLDGEPVKDNGVLVVVDKFEPGQTTVVARISRYRSIDDETTWTLELTATDDGADVTGAVESSDPET